MNTYKKLTNIEYNVLQFISHKTKMDAWFDIRVDKNGNFYVFDSEDNRKYSLKDGIELLVEGLDCRENYENCFLTPQEDYTFSQLCKKLNIEFGKSWGYVEPTL